MLCLSLTTILIIHERRDIAETFTVNTYIDNGQLEGPGTANPRWIRRNAHTNTRNITVREISDSDITTLPARTGLTDAEIDPLVCDNCDPEISILSGRLDENPGWPHRAFDNKNNHSLVIRIDFGESSFLFTGDLEEEAIKTLVLWYDETDRLDVDVYQVGHHGSYNGTTATLLQAMTPEVAIVSCGDWDIGRNTRGAFTTYAYGHPRRVVLDLLGVSITKRRSRSITVMAAEAARDFGDFRVQKRIYATPWDGTIKVRANLQGNLRITRNN